MIRKYKNYEVGEPIKSLDELLQQDFVFWIPAFQHIQLIHVGWFESWQLHYAYVQIRLGHIFKATKKAVKHEP